MLIEYFFASLYLTESCVVDPLCHFDADPDPACHFDPIRILPFTLLRIRIVASKLRLKTLK